MAEFTQHATACQKYVRGFVARRLYADMKQAAKKCEEEMKRLNDVVGQVAASVKPLQKKLLDEDAKNWEVEKQKAEEKKELEAKKKEKGKQDQDRKEEKTKPEQDNTVQEAVD